MVRHGLNGRLVVPKFKGKTGNPNPEWATYSELRSPKFKVHTKEGLAKSAYSGQRDLRREVQLLKFNAEDGDWDIVLDWTLPTLCQCGNTYEYDKWGRKAIHYYYDPQDKRGNWEKPFICRECYYKSYNEKQARYKEAEELKQLADLKAKYEGK